MKILLASVALAASTALGGGTAGAADIAPSYPVTKAPAVARAVPTPYNWTGFYVGGNVGYGWAHASTDVVGPAGLSRSVGENLDGANGGVQLGYRWQLGQFVFGFETDIQAAGQSSSSTALCPAATCGVAVTVNHTDKMPWFGTTRSHLGWAADRWLFYFTSGIAYGEVKSDLTVTAASTATGSTSRTGTAWTLGGGVEVALSENWSGKLEYLWVDTRNVTNTATVAGFGTVTSTSRVDNNIVRVGLNYRFY